MRINWKLLKPFSIYFRNIQGLDNIPDGPCLITSNHLSSLDTIMLILAFRRPITYIAQSRLLNDWLHRLIDFHIGQAIPDNHHTISQAVERLRQGYSVGIFPEGDIHPNHRTDRIHTGAYVISQQAQVPIIPVHITGSDAIWPVTFWPLRPWKTKNVDMIIGTPISPLLSDQHYPREFYQQRANELLQHIKQLSRAS
ncbi:MAG: lysophospholipid acyltransferase family protein [Patescibacteria group bacterium]|jgi:1-acyl-sn-glycerol-3-phosphate acyltransferase